MILSEFWEAQNLINNLYTRCTGSVCAKYDLTRMELDILLFLANNPQFDTASDIVERRLLTKSHVSTSIKSLVERGYLARAYAPANRKTVHLSICPAAASIIADGRAAQEEFFSTLFLGFSEADRQQLRRFFIRIADNVNRHAP